MGIEKIDFNALYMEQKKISSFKMKSVEEWDKKAKHMNKRVHHSMYNEAFLNRIDTTGCHSVLDVGCGVGNLSLLLAKSIECVYALDYSQGMLDTLAFNAKTQNLQNIQMLKKSWRDSWDDVPKADIVIASRSMEVDDMQASLKKLNDWAKKKVFLSYKVGGSFVSEEILEVLGRKIIKKPDYIYLVNILYGMGIHAKVDFIQSEGRSSVYKDCDAFVQSITWSLGTLTQDEINLLTVYYQNNHLTMQESQPVQWAVISWEKSQ